MERGAWSVKRGEMRFIRTILRYLRSVTCDEETCLAFVGRSGELSRTGYGCVFCHGHADDDNESHSSHDQPQAVHVSLTAKHETDRRGHVSEMDVSDRRGLRVGTMEAAVIAEIEA